MKRVTPTDLRRDVYALLDSVLDSGEPIEIVRSGRRLLIVAPSASRSSIWEVPEGRSSALKVSWDELEQTTFEYTVDTDAFPLLAADR